MSGFTIFTCTFLFFSVTAPYLALTVKGSRISHAVEALMILALGAGAGELIWMATSNMPSPRWKLLGLIALLWAITVSGAKIFVAARGRNTIPALAWTAFIFTTLPAVFEISFSIHRSGWWRVGEIVSGLVWLVVIILILFENWLENEKRRPDPLYY